MLTYADVCWRVQVQHVAIIASAFAKAKIFDEGIFAHLSRAVRWRGRATSEFTVQAVSVLLFAFSRIQVDHDAASVLNLKLKLLVRA